MFEIFRTNIEDRETASRIITLLRHQFSGRQANVDLEDRDRLLRIHGLEDDDKSRLISFLDGLGVKAVLLD